jgi:hypothetical protein
MGRQPSRRRTQGDEKRPLSGNRSPSKRRLLLCHLACPGAKWDRSVPGFPVTGLTNRRV